MRIIRNIGIIFIVSLLIMATGGFSIYRHICNCGDEMSASLFIEAGCQHEKTPAPCCSAEKNSSCCTEQPGHKTKNTCHNDNCCQDSFQFLKIYDSFQPGLEKISLKPFPVISTIEFSELRKEINCTPTFLINTSDLPPPKTGRKILALLHQLKLDPNLV